MKLKLITLTCLIFCFFLEAIAQIPKEISEKPQNGFVPDKETAIAIAVAVWTPIYGKKKILKEKPFQAVLTNGVWIVRGSLPEGYKGGVAIAEISKDTGCILRVIHEK